MRKHVHPWQLLLGTLLFSVCLTGCSSPESRSKEKPEAFKKLNAKEQAAVLEGKLRPGMNSDAVYIALGKPARIEKENGKSRDEERWIYTKAEYYQIPHWTPRETRGPSGNAFFFTEYDPIQMRKDVDSFMVIFKNGKVVTWQKLRD